MTLYSKQRCIFSDVGTFNSLKVFIVCSLCVMRDRLVEVHRGTKQQVAFVFTQHIGINFAALHSWGICYLWRKQVRRFCFFCFFPGLPYSVTTLDIEEFFRPLNCVEIKLGYNEERRLSGDALVTFSTMAEAREALARNKKNMGTR